MPVISNNPVANQWYVFFPTESQINADYLSHTNSYRDKELNKDPEATPGFFEKNGRVKTVKLRGEYSTGYITPLSSVEEFLVQEIEKKIAKWAAGFFGEACVSDQTLSSPSISIPYIFAMGTEDYCQGYFVRSIKD